MTLWRQRLVQIGELLCRVAKAVILFLAGLETTTNLVEPTPAPPPPSPAPSPAPTADLKDATASSALASLPPLHVVATKTYLTTFTYFTTLLQGNTPAVSTVVSSRTRVVQNVVTESVATSLLHPEYVQRLRSSFRVSLCDRTT